MGPWGTYVPTLATCLPQKSTVAFGSMRLLICRRIVLFVDSTPSIIRFKHMYTWVGWQSSVPKSSIQVDFHLTGPANQKRVLRLLLATKLCWSQETACYEVPVILPLYRQCTFLAPTNSMYLFSLIYTGHFIFLRNMFTFSLNPHTLGYITVLCKCFPSFIFSDTNMSFRVGVGQVMPHVSPYYITKTSMMS